MKAGASNVRLLTLIEGAWQDLAWIERELARRRGQPAGVGELFVALATAELAVEWAVIDRDPDTGEVVAVPADTFPGVGSGEVRVRAEAAGGPLALRCGFAVVVAADHLDPALRTGLLDPDAVARACARRSALAAGTLTPSRAELETDADPEYVAWIVEVLEPARRRMQRPRAHGNSLARFRHQRCQCFDS